VYQKQSLEFQEAPLQKFHHKNMTDGIDNYGTSAVTIIKKEYTYQRNS